MNKILTLMLVSISTTLVAAPSDDANKYNMLAFADSVHNWGPWNSGVAPAAGPLGTGIRPLNVRPSDIRFRPADSHRYQSSGARVVTQQTTPPAPVTPPAPPATSGPAITHDNPATPPSGRP